MRPSHCSKTRAGCLGGLQTEMQGKEPLPVQREALLKKVSKSKTFMIKVIPSN
ncbi:Protein of unknown function [Gryllus bimaculatus]|nr:Protein of unknown function [Gryllus bimaculatus]